MISVQHAPLILLVLAFVLAGSALSRLTVPRVALSDERVSYMYRWSRYGMRAVVPLFVIAVIYYVTICLPLVPLAPDWVRWGFYVCLLIWALFEFIQTWSIPRKVLEGKQASQLVAPVSTLGGLIVSLVLLTSSPVLFQGDSAYINLEFPGEGEWLVIHAGEHPAVNVYAGSQSQIYAVEMINLDSGRQVPNFRTRIMAPASGTVVAVMEGHLDTHQSEYFEDQLGNYITISIGNGAYVILGHLQISGLDIEIGDRLEMGQEIATTSSGCLHVRVQDRPEFSPEASTFPFSFRNVNRKRFVSRHLDQARVLRNDVVSAGLSSRTTPGN